MKVHLSAIDPNSYPVSPPIDWDTEAGKCIAMAFYLATLSFQPKIKVLEWANAKFPYHAHLIEDEWLWAQTDGATCWLLALNYLAPVEVDIDGSLGDYFEENEEEEKEETPQMLEDPDAWDNLFSG